MFRTLLLYCFKEYALLCLIAGDGVGVKLQILGENRSSSVNYYKSVT